MKYFFIILTLLIMLAQSCTKEKEIIPQEPTKPILWKKYVGYYKVYNTLGNYMYNMNIFHTQSLTSQNVQPNDSLTIVNFTDTFDLKYEFRETVDDNVFSIGIFDSIVDKNNKIWY